MSSAFRKLISSSDIAIERKHIKQNNSGKSAEICTEAKKRHFCQQQVCWCFSRCYCHCCSIARWIVAQFFYAKASMRSRYTCHECKRIVFYWNIRIFTLKSTWYLKSIPKLAENPDQTQSVSRLSIHRTQRKREGEGERRRREERIKIEYCFYSIRILPSLRAEIHSAERLVALALSTANFDYTGENRVLPMK